MGMRPGVGRQAAGKVDTRLPVDKRLGRLLVLALRPVILLLMTCLVLCGTTVLNIVQFFSMPFMLFSRVAVMSLHSVAADKLMALPLQICFEKLSGADICVTGDEVLEGESALVFSNHLGTVDFYFLHMLARQGRMLCRVRYFAKDSIKYIPLFGWGFWMMGNILLQRSWLHDSTRIRKRFELFTKSKQPIWLVSFLEGSRLTAQKLRQSQEYCHAHGLPILNHLLYPRKKGFIASIKALRDSHVKYIYDVTIASWHHRHGFGTIPSVLNMQLLGLHNYRLHVHVRRFAIKDLPLQDSELGSWIENRFVEKDMFLDRLKENYKRPKLS